MNDDDIVTCISCGEKDPYPLMTRIDYTKKWLCKTCLFCLTDGWIILKRKKIVAKYLGNKK